MSTETAKPSALVRAHQLVQLIGEVLAVAVVVRSLLGGRRRTTMDTSTRDQPTRCP